MHHITAYSSSSSSFLSIQLPTHIPIYLSSGTRDRRADRQRVTSSRYLSASQYKCRYAYNSNKILIYCLRATITIKIKPCGTRTCAVKIAQTLLNNNSTPKKNYGGRHIHNTYPSHSYIHVHSWKPRFLRTTEWILFVAGKLISHSTLAQASPAITIACCDSFSFLSVCM